MPWVKLDDAFTDHPKIELLSDRAFRLHVAGLCFCGRMLSDGLVPADRVRRLLPKVTKAMVDELVRARLWKPVDAGFQITGYLEYNPSKAEVEKARAEAAERKRRWNERRNGVRNASRNASGNAAPTQPGPTRPEGSRAGSVAPPLAEEAPPLPSGGDASPDTTLPSEVTERNVHSIREAKARLRSGAA